jgi:hypothetical protein
MFLSILPGCDDVIVLDGVECFLQALALPGESPAVDGVTHCREERRDRKRLEIVTGLGFAAPLPTQVAR